jgi:hypothetical protein
MPHSIERKHWPMTKEKMKFTDTVMACPADRVSIVCISDGTCSSSASQITTVQSHKSTLKPAMQMIVQAAEEVHAYCECCMHNRQMLAHQPAQGSPAPCKAADKDADERKHCLGSSTADLGIICAEFHRLRSGLVLTQHEDADKTQNPKQG